MKKVLIIPGALQIGGAERVAANICKYAPKDLFEFHYLVFEGFDNVYGPEIESRGGKVYTIPSPSTGYLAYFRRLCKLIRENRYDAVHSHTQFNSGINLLAAKLCGVPVRVAHSHTTKTETKVSTAQKWYEQVMRFLIRLMATDYFACGVEAGKWMYGERLFRKDGVVIHNGIDTNEFHFSEQCRRAIRKQYGISETAFVIGHSGTLSVLKNQELLIRMMPAVLSRRKGAVLMLVGRGEEKITTHLKQLAEDSGVSDHIVFTGGVLNVNEHLSAMDVFAFPSKREGTPLALLEAQANGLQCVVSANVPEDAFITDLIHTLSISQIEPWAETTADLNRSNSSAYADRVAAAGYGIITAYQPVFDAYLQTKKLMPEKWGERP